LGHGVRQRGIFTDMKSVSSAGPTVDVSAQSGNCARLPVTSWKQVNWSSFIQFPVSLAAERRSCQRRKENVSESSEENRREFMSESSAARGKKSPFTS
jgi:hypothetical protein